MEVEKYVEYPMIVPVASKITLDYDPKSLSQEEQLDDSEEPETIIFSEKEPSMEDTVEEVVEEAEEVVEDVVEAIEQIIEREEPEHMPKVNDCSHCES